MSRIGTKRIHHTPVRSPSPDLVHKNINVRTSSPINEVLMKERIAKLPKNPTGLGFLNTEQYDNCIHNLQQQNRRLSKENSSLHEENIRNLKEIDFLKEMNIKSRKQLYKKSQPQLMPQHDAYSQYETRIGDLLNEIRRIQDLLSKEIKKNEALLRENDELKTQRDMRLRMAPYEQAKMKKQLTDIQDKLNEEMEQIVSLYETKLSQALSRINKLENDHIVIRNLVENKKVYESPAQYDRKGIQYSSTKNQTPSASYNRPEILIKGSSSQSEHFHPSEFQPAQCQNCKLYKIRIAQLEVLLKARQLALTHQEKYTNASVLGQYLQKLTEIKGILGNEEVKTSIDCIQTNLNDIYSINQKFEYMTLQKNKVIQDLREKQIKQSLQLISLKKENGIMKVQITQQNEEISKLQELINRQFATFTKESQVQVVPKSDNSVSQAEILRKCLEEAVSRIQLLENQIQDSISAQHD